MPEDQNYAGGADGAQTDRPLNKNDESARNEPRSKLYGNEKKVFEKITVEQQAQL